MAQDRGHGKLREGITEALQGRDEADEHGRWG